MAMVYIGGTPITYPEIATGFEVGGGDTLTTLATLNASGLKAAFIGKWFIPGVAIGATKTASAAGGGSVSFNAGAVTFANGTTKLDVGIQGVSTSAGPVVRPDDAFTVKKTLTGGTDTINSTTENTFTFDSGSATLTNGALAAVVLDMTARGGADSVVVRYVSGTGTIIPCAQLFSAAAWATSVTAATPVIRVNCDDGTIAYLENGISISAAATETWADATNPDERGNIIQVPFDCVCSGIWMVGGITDASSTFTYAIYSSPTSSPSLVANSSGTFDPHQATTTGNDRLQYLPASGDVSLSKNTDYAVVIRATGTSNVRLNSWTVSASANRTWFGNGTAGKTTRDGGSGNFSSASTTVGYFMGLTITQIDDGASSGGAAGGSYVFV